jgi:hypothetical protein
MKVGRRFVAGLVLATLLGGFAPEPGWAREAAPGQVKPPAKPAAKQPAVSRGGAPGSHPGSLGGPAGKGAGISGTGVQPKK